VGTARPDPAAGPPPGRPFRAEDLFDEIGYYVLGRPDLDRAKAFYGSVFGWRFAEENTTPRGSRGAHVTSSKVPFGLTEDPTIHTYHPWFRVTDLRATIERIRAAGGEVVEQHDYSSGGSARCRDDQGVEFDLWQAAPGY
jgi:predicted enzyme related to lactoylglutathione lyase